MANESHSHESAPAVHHEPHDAVEMPRPTTAPLVLSLGLIFMAAGAVTSEALMVVGGLLALLGAGMWIEQLLPGRGHFHEAFVAPELRAVPITGEAGNVQELHVDMPGYRIRMPEQVHPISAGVKGGILGGVVMPIPALLYGVLSGHGIWYPINLLAGMMLPGMDQMSTEEFEQFHFGYVAVAVAIHVVMSLSIGVIYGVLMPTLPDIPKALAWGALLAPMLWTGVSYFMMSVVNPVLEHGVVWPWFIASQFLFGVVLASVMMASNQAHPVRAGMIGAGVGGVVMALPAMLWGYLSGYGIWYPVNLLAGMGMRGMDQLPVDELSRFRADWFIAATVIHIAMAVCFGGMLGLLLPRLPSIPGPLAWGGMMLPLVWTASSYALMGVVNPLLADRVDWPWFIFSQLIFGLTAAIVVVRSEMVHIPPAGKGPDKIPVVEGQ